MKTLKTVDEGWIYYWKYSGGDQFLGFFKNNKHYYCSLINQGEWNTMKEVKGGGFTNLWEPDLKFKIRIKVKI
jgi:hypothetical protein